MCKEKKITIPRIILFVSPLITGLLTNVSVFLVMFLCFIGIVYKAIQKKRIAFPKGKNILLLLIYVFSFLLVEIWAVDKGMNLFGFLRACLLPLFLILMAQYEKEEFSFEQVLQDIPYAGVCSLGVSILLMLLRHPEIIIDNRLNGTFFYANSYALFLLLGVFILLTKEKITWKDILFCVLLILGIFCTKSRGVVLLLFAVLSVVMVMKLKKTPKKLLGAILVYALIIVLFILSPFGERFRKGVFKSSEFLTRLVIYEDAIHMVTEHPLGLGYQGYYYKQAEMKTAFYDTKDAHCFVLQLVLDVGFLPALCIMCWIANSLLLAIRRKEKSYIGIIVLILLHSCVDMNLEYYYFWLLLALFTEWDNTYLHLKNLIGIAIIAFAVGIANLVLCMASCLFECKEYDKAYHLVPFYTDAMIQKLYTTKDSNEQIILANQIYLYNQHLTAVYQILSIVEQQHHEYLKALPYEQKRLALNYLNTSAYEKYFEFLKKAFDDYYQEKEYNSLNQIMEEMLLIRDKMQEANDLAKPSFVPTIFPSEEMIKTFEAIEELKK